MTLYVDISLSSNSSMLEVEDMADWCMVEDIADWCIDFIEYFDRYSEYSKIHNLAASIMPHYILTMSCA
jgi:hypothetical protein